MRPLALHFLRRAALYAFLAAVLLLFVPRFLMEFGVLGEDAAVCVERAGRAVEAARTYGATPQMTAMRDAERQLQSARELVRQGEKREARRAAAAATANAVEAQRAALVARQEQQRRAGVHRGRRGEAAGRAGEVLRRGRGGPRQGGGGSSASA
jgi:hypothetical protein